MGVIHLKLKYSLGSYKVVALSHVRYVPSFVGNLFSISTAMTKGAEIRFKNKQMEVQKGDATFEFLRTNSDNCGLLFRIEAQRIKYRPEKALLAQKQPTHDIKI